MRTILDRVLALAGTAVVLYLTAGFIAYLWQGHAWPSSRVWYTLILLSTAAVGVALVVNYVLDSLNGCLALLLIFTVVGSAVTATYNYILKPLFDNPAIGWNVGQQIVYGIAGLACIVGWDSWVSRPRPPRVAAEESTPETKPDESTEE